MAEPSSTEGDTTPKKYHQHPLFLHLPLEEAIRQGLAVPTELDYKVGKLRRDNKRRERLRSARSMANFRQDVPVAAPAPGYGLDDGSLTESPEMPRRLETTGTAKTLNMSLSLEATNGSGNRSSPNSGVNKMIKDTKNKIHQKTQESMGELKDRLDLYENTPIPASKSIRKRNPAPVLRPRGENNSCNIERQGLGTEQTTFPASSLSPTSTKIPSPGQPQSQEHCEPRSQLQCDPQANPKTPQAGKQEDSSTKTPRSTSSLRTPTYSLFPKPPATPTRIHPKPQQSPHGLSINAPLLGSFNKPLPPPPSLSQLPLSPPLPLHLRPENQYSPRPSLDAGPRISFATEATLYNEETKSTTQVPLKMPGVNKISYKTSKDQEKSLSMAKHFPPPPCPPPNYPPPPPPTPKRPQESAEETPVNPYDIEFATAHFDRNSNTYTNNTDTDTATATVNDDVDEDTGGWLALHKRRHQRAIAQYLAAATAEKPPSHHSSANVESVRMENETQTFGADSTMTEVSVASGVAGSDHPVASADSERPPKASFLGRCGKALTKKRSFWRKKDDDED
ncbi:hypothetical protein GGR58DRAFT_504856 [Xylaria digitata]|nr:hypothetical protein GGR58DRAFT_504856 [Xylaria digitata]